MDKPTIAGTTPIVTELEPGSYFWCTCGDSENQPYCDGAHAAGNFKPLRFEVTEKKKVALCTCKITGNAPFCDGAHKDLKG